MSTFRAHFSLKHRAIAFISTRLFTNLVYTMRHGLAAGMRRKGGLGFLPFNETPSAESEFLASLHLDGKTVYDLGGFEGVLTLFFARSAAAVITYEPNPRNYQRCVDNVELNRLTNVRVLNRGVSDQKGTLELVFDPLMPGATSGNREIAGQIHTQIAKAGKIDVPVVTLDADVLDSNLPAPDLIKIDIEGMELPALLGMTHTLETYHPDLFIELHGAELEDKIRNATEVMEYLGTVGYRAFDVENRKYIPSSPPLSYAPSHLYCTKGGSRVGPQAL
jgi:FkbM family methyltransferase